MQCTACDLHFANPQPSDSELAAIYGPDYALAAEGTATHAGMIQSKRATADHYLDLLPQHGVPANARLLEVGCGSGHLLRQAAERGYDVTGVEYSPFACERARQTLGGRGRVFEGEIDVLREESSAYDVCILCDVIEHVRNPGEFLQHAARLLRPGGIVLVVTPSRDSWSARAMGARWMEYKPEHLFYFNSSTISRQLVNAGFAHPTLHPGTKLLSLDYVTAHFEKYPVPGIVQVLRGLRALAPAALNRRLFRVVASGLIAVAQKPAPTARTRQRAASAEPVKSSRQP